MEWILLFVVVVIVLYFIGDSEKKKEKKKKEERTKNIKSRLLKIENFKVSKQIVGFGWFYLFAIDNESEKFCYLSTFETKIHDFKDIIGVEIIEDGTTIAKKETTRTIGGAIVGGALAGGAGAIIGGLSGNSAHKKNISTLSVKILLRDTSNPTLTIRCFESKTMTSQKKRSIETEGDTESNIYKRGKHNAETIKDLVSVIIDKIDKSERSQTQVSPRLENNSIADEIMKLNGLREKGVISDSEFVSLKSKILDN